MTQIWTKLLLLTLDISWQLKGLSQEFFVNKHNAVPQTSRERQLEKHRYLGSPKDGGWPKPMETILSPDSENVLRPIIVQIQFLGFRALVQKTAAICLS
jgi:hypothetical protein